MLKQITLELPSKYEIESGKITVRIHTETWTQQQAGRIFAEAIPLGLAQMVSSTQPEMARRKAQLLTEGVIPENRLPDSPEIQGWIAYCHALKLKEGGKPVSRRNLEQAQKTLCRQALIAAHAPGTPERKAIQADIGTALKEQFEAWKAEQESNPDTVGGFIELKRNEERLARLVQGTISG